MITNTFKNARACSGGYLQTKILEFIESVIIVKKREKIAMNSIKNIDAWL